MRDVLSILLMRIYPLVVLIVMLLTIVGCGEDGSVDGPCYHELLSPIVEIESATVTGTGEKVETIVIQSVSIDGVVEDLNELAGSTSFGVSVVAGTLVCEVPCGFGTYSGHYSIAVAGENLLSQTLEFDADYARYWGSCPSFSEGASKVALRLSRP